MRVKDLVISQIEYANKQLARHSDSFDNSSSECEFKMGVIALLENMLHDTGNYNGFMFVDNNQIEIGTPGYFSRKYFLP
jgi:hypothetical protein